jgi:hypothetical protein
MDPASRNDPDRNIIRQGAAMVKRVIAAFAGAIAGALLWFAFHAFISAKAEPDATVEACESGPLVDCVGYAAPERAPSDAVTAAASCKHWLSGEGASIALLSQCLHAAPMKEPRAAKIGRSI